MVSYDLLGLLCSNKGEKHFKLLRSLKCWMTKEKEERIKCFRIDHGCEFSYYDFKRFCDTHRIKSQLTAPYTPHHNGIVERKKYYYVTSKKYAKRERITIRIVGRSRKYFCLCLD